MVIRGPGPHPCWGVQAGGRYWRHLAGTRLQGEGWPLDWLLSSLAVPEGRYGAVDLLVGEDMAGGWVGGCWGTGALCLLLFGALPRAGKTHSSNSPSC